MDLIRKIALWSVVLWVVGSWGCPSPPPSGEQKAEKPVSTEAGEERSGSEKQGSDGGESIQDSGLREQPPEPRGREGASERPVERAAPEPAPEKAREPLHERSPEPAGEVPPEPRTTGWQIPTCASVAGLASVAFSVDGGKTLRHGGRSWPQGIQYTYGLVALKAANTLVAHYGDAFYRSTDAGCTWTRLGNGAGGVLRLTLAAKDRVWAWSDNRGVLYRIDGAQIQKITPPAPEILGVGTHPTDPKRLRIGSKRGSIYESFDGGQLWKKLGTQATQTSVLNTYRVAFNPNDLDHIITGTSREGFYVSFDGAKTWKSATGLAAKAGDPANAFNAAFAPSNGNVVWAMGIDLNNTSSKGNGKHLYRSIDGGLTFAKIVTHQQQQDLVLINGPNLVPHPTDDAKLYWAFGSCAGQFGTRLYLYDHATRQVTMHAHPYPSFDEIVLSPASARVIYLGIQTNSSPLCPK